MAIFSPIILLAQNASSSINTNLQDSENMLQNANQELDVLKDQYNNILSQSPDATFFNFGNLYFWLVLVGLLLLAFGLLFLLAELQNKDRGKKSKVAERKEELPIDDAENDETESELDQEAEEEKVEEELAEEEQDLDDDQDEEEDLPKKKSSKPIKIKVQKIK